MVRNRVPGLIASLVFCATAHAGEQPEIHRCVDADGAVSFLETPCPAGTQREPVALHETHFDADPPVAPVRVGRPGAATPVADDPGDDLVTWEEVECHAAPAYWGRQRFPFPRNRGAICHTVTRTATRRERCRELDGYFETFRDSTITWRDRREELIETKRQLLAVRCCSRVSETSLSNARAPACVGRRPFSW